MDRHTYRDMRLEMGLTQPQLASRLDVHWQTVSKRETGHRPITVEAELAIHWLHRESRHLWDKGEDNE